jgi:uncharacterized protein YhfF
MEHKSVSSMWENYLAMLDKDGLKNRTFISWHFCSDKKSANDLATLVKKGIKTATSLLYLLYELGGEEIPKKRNMNVITDWDGRAQAATETISVNLVSFEDVNKDFAKKEGEGDRSLDYWRKVHLEFFTKELLNLGRGFSENMLIVCEKFKLVYK